MSENSGVTVEEKPRSDPAFEIVGIDREKGTVIVELKKGILGSTANQLKNTSNKRKGASIIRKLGFELAHAGDILYKSSEEERLDDASD